MFEKFSILTAKSKVMEKVTEIHGIWGAQREKTELRCVKASLKLVSSWGEFHVEVEDVIQHFVN